MIEATTTLTRAGVSSVERGPWSAGGAAAAVPRLEARSYPRRR